MKLWYAIRNGIMALVACGVVLGQITPGNLPPATQPLTGNEAIPMQQGQYVVQAPANTVGTPLNTFTQITSLWTAPCNAANQFLNGAGTCTNPATPPGGNTNDVQYNAGGTFGGSDNFTFTPSGPSIGIMNLTGDFNITRGNGTPGVALIAPSNPAGSKSVCMVANVNSTSQPPNLTGITAPNVLGLGGCADSGDPALNANAINIGVNNGSLKFITLGNLTDTTALISNYGPVVMNSSGSNVGLTVNGNSNQWTEVINGTGVSNFNFGLRVLAGAGASDYALQVANSSTTQIFEALKGDGSGGIGPNITGTPTGISWDTAGATTIGGLTASESALIVNGVAAAGQNFAEVITSPNTSNQSWGLKVQAGTSASDIPLMIRKAGSGTILNEIFGDGHGGSGPNPFGSPAVGTTWDALGSYLVNSPSSTEVTMEIDGYPGSSTLFIKPGVGNGGVGPNRNGLFIIGASPAQTSDELLIVNQTSGANSLHLDGGGGGNIGKNSTVNGLSWPPGTGAFTMQGAAGPELSVNASASNAGILVTGVTGASALQINGPSSGGTVGLAVNTGGTSADELITIGTNGGSQFLNIFGDGHGQLGPTTGSHDLIWNANGAFTLNLPASGTAFTNLGSQVNGTPTGGDKGTGTINAQGLYVNGVAVSAGGIPAPITCTTACSGASLVVGQQLIINKTSSTSRASTTTQTIDADLNVTAMPNSSYATVFISLYFGAGANAGGYRAVLNNGGACNTGFPGSGYWSFNNNTPAVSRGDAANPIAFTSSSASEWVQFTGTIQGNSGISVCWAQNTSNVTNTTLNGNGLIGTFIVVTRVL